jgi:hypothetical protein
MALLIKFDRQECSLLVPSNLDCGVLIRLNDYATCVARLLLAFRSDFDSPSNIIASPTPYDRKCLLPLASRRLLSFLSRISFAGFSYCVDSTVIDRWRGFRALSRALRAISLSDDRSLKAWISSGANPTRSARAANSDPLLSGSFFD